MEKRTLNYKIRPATKAERKEILNLSNGGYISFIYCVVTEILFYIVWFYLVVTLSIQPVIFHVHNNSLAIDVILLSVGGFMVFSLMPLFCYLCNNPFRNIYKNGLIAVCEERIVGFVKLSIYRQAAELVRLYVHPEYRHQGIGTDLVKTAVSKTDLPVYQNCYLFEDGFYTRLGFIYTLINPLRKPFFDLQGINRLVLKNKIELSNLPRSSIASRVHQVGVKDINSFKFISGGAPGELFLPFGINRIFPVGLKSILILTLFFLFFILFLISGIYFYKISSVILIVMFLAVLFVLPKLTNLIIRRHLSQLWIVKYGDSSVGYGRLSYNSEYSILHSINCLGKTYDLKDTRSILIKYLIQLANKPIYLACDRKEAEIYSHYGFIAIEVNKLPKKLQFGGKLNRIFGGINLFLP